MRLRFKRPVLAAVLWPWLCLPASAAGRLEIAQAWIREAPPGAMMLAGYAVLRNTGDAAVTITGADSDAFGNVSLHESIEENGVERMRPVGRLQIPPGASVTLAPGGKHLMLMRPAHPLKSGDAVRIRIVAGPGQGASAEFTVRDSASD